ncbi:cupin domain-containing protein [bacterium]|nr:MAG: cupin domain-containing protein [bacterium]
MGKIDPSKAQEFKGTGYPKPFDAPVLARAWKSLGDVAGISQFGVNLVTLEPGVWSSQRHWHMHEDEFVWVLEGDVVLVTDAGETPMTAGECAGFKAGERDGHCFRNLSSRDVKLLVVGTRVERDYGEYSDIDMTFESEAKDGESVFRRKSGEPY